MFPRCKDDLEEELMNKIGTLVKVTVVGSTLITAQKAAGSDVFTANETSSDIFGYGEVFPRNTKDYTVFRFGFRLKFQ
jgi:hypothetical protein